MNPFEAIPKLPPLYFASAEPAFSPVRDPLVLRPSLILPTCGSLYSFLPLCRLLRRIVPAATLCSFMGPSEFMHYVSARSHVPVSDDCGCVSKLLAFTEALRVRSIRISSPQSAHMLCALYKARMFVYLYILEDTCFSSTTPQICAL